MWLKLTLYLFILYTCCNCDPTTNHLGNNNTGKNLHVGFLFARELLGHSVSVSLKIGLEMAKQNLPGYAISYTMRDSKCNAKIGMEAVLNLQRENQKLDAIIGSQCSVVCEPVGLLTSLWNIPQVASRCSSMLLSDKTMYPTFTRASGNTLYTSKIIMNVLQTFGWLRFSIVSSDDPVFKLSAEYLMKYFGQHDMDVQLYTFSTSGLDKNINLKKLDVLRSLIEVVKESSRVTLLYMFDTDLRNFLILAKEQELMDRDTVLIGLDSAYRGSILATRSIKPLMTDSEIYQGVIAVKEDDPPMTEHWEKLKNEALSIYQKQNISKEEMEAAKAKHEIFSGEEK